MTVAAPCALRDARDEQAYGGKAVALGTASRAGLPVPPGLALPVALVAAVRDGDVASRGVVPERLRQLAKRAASCDRVFGAASDLEWASAGGRLALLQRRPLTSSGH